MSSIVPILSPSRSTRVRPRQVSMSCIVAICLTSWLVARPAVPWSGRPHEPMFDDMPLLASPRWPASADAPSRAAAVPTRYVRGMAWNVVIAGGGFGGFYAARTLERTMPPASTRITLVSDVNFMLYTPLLPGAAAGTLEPRHVVVPLREALERTDLRIGTIVDADPARRIVRVEALEGHVEELPYDQLVVAV